MQAIGRLMRPISYEQVPRKLATLFLTCLSGKKLDISGNGAEPNPEDNDNTGDETRTDEHDNPKTRYTTSSMTLSEAYDLPIPVFYKTEVGFRDFINQTRIDDANTVERVKRKSIDPEELDKFDPMALKQELNRLRNMVRAQYKRFIQERDSKEVDGRKLWYCHGKQVVGERGCDRTQLEVPLEIHHKEPFTFTSLYKKFRADGVIEWHRKSENMKHLVSLCPRCHDLAHATREDEDIA